MKTMIVSMAQNPADGAFEHGAFLFPVRVYYEDTDFSGFVYHANYLRFFERGRSEALRTVGISHRELLGWETPSAMVVRRMEIDFVRPAVVEDDLLVRTEFMEAKGARMRMKQILLRGEDVIARAEVEAALVSLDGRPRKVPRELLAKLRSFVAAPAP